LHFARYKRRHRIFFGDLSQNLIDNKRLTIKISQNFVGRFFVVDIDFFFVFLYQFGAKGWRGAAFQLGADRPVFLGLKYACMARSRSQMIRRATD
jgi:hypothetical protein